MTREDTKKIIAVLKANYPNSFKNISTEDLRLMLNLWAEGFKDIPYQLVAKAVQTFIFEDSREFVPNVAQIRSRCIELICPNAENLASEAWTEVLEHVRSCWPSEAAQAYNSLPKETKQALSFGDFTVLISNSPDNNEIYQRPAFEKAYVEKLKGNRNEMLRTGKIMEIADTSKLAELGISARKEIGHDTDQQSS